MQKMFDSIVVVVVVTRCVVCCVLCSLVIGWVCEMEPAWHGSILHRTYTYKTNRCVMEKLKIRKCIEYELLETNLI